PCVWIMSEDKSDARENHAAACGFGHGTVALRFGNQRQAHLCDFQVPGSLCITIRVNDVDRIHSARGEGGTDKDLTCSTAERDGLGRIVDERVVGIAQEKCYISRGRTNQRHMGGGATPLGYLPIVERQ